MMINTAKQKTREEGTRKRKQYTTNTIPKSCKKYTEKKTVFTVPVVPEIKIKSQDKK